LATLLEPFTEIWCFFLKFSLLWLLKISESSFVLALFFTIFLKNGYLAICSPGYKKNMKVKLLFKSSIFLAKLLEPTTMGRNLATFLKIGSNYGH
jgi:hypothetical protein